MSGGIGAALASVAAAAIQAVSRKGESRATAAELLTTAASGLVDRLNALNKDKDAELARTRDMLIRVVDCLEELVPYAPDPEHTRACLREAHRFL